MIDQDLDLLATAIRSTTSWNISILVMNLSIVGASIIYQKQIRDLYRHPGLFFIGAVLGGAIILSSLVFNYFVIRYYFKVEQIASMGCSETSNPYVLATVNLAQIGFIIGAIAIFLIFGSFVLVWCVLYSYAFNQTQ